MYDIVLPPSYHLREGSSVDRASLVKFMQTAYHELFPDQRDFSHLAKTVDQYFYKETPLWWVEFLNNGQGVEPIRPRQLVAVLWMGNVIDQAQGDRYAHIFILYVMPEHRRRGIGTALMRHAENWARTRGDRQIGLQVYQTNKPALALYQQLSYQTESLWMIKPLIGNKHAE